MKGFQKRFICPVCKYERWVEVSDVLFIRHVAQIALISLALMTLLFRSLDTFVFLIPFPVYLAYEFARSWINRERMVCNRCDFDPFLYKVSVEKARARCESKLKKVP